MILNEIQAMIDSGDTHDALMALGHVAVEGSVDDEMYYAMGRMYWHLDRRAEAMRCYRMAVELNPESKARHALEIATDVFDFFNPDLLNP